MKIVSFPLFLQVFFDVRVFVFFNVFYVFVRVVPGSRFGHPPGTLLAIWGAGRKARNRSGPLQNHGFTTVRARFWKTEFFYPKREGSRERLFPLSEALLKRMFFTIIGGSRVGQNRCFTTVRARF